MRIILIQIGDDGRIEVREDGRTTDQLSWDEMLGQIAEMTHPRIQRGRYPLRTEVEWQKRFNRPSQG